MKSTTSSLVSASALPATSRSRVSVLNVEITPPMTLPLKLVSVLLASESTASATVLLAVESTKSSKMGNAAAKLATTLLAASVDNATGMKYTIRVWVSAVFLVVVTTSSISVSRDVSAYPISGKWLMEPAQLVFFTLPMIRSPKLAFATEDMSIILAFAYQTATPTSNSSMESVSAEQAIILLATAAVFALQPRSMTQLTEFVTFLVRTTKSGIPSFVPADVYLDITSSTVYAQLVTPRPSSTIKFLSVVTAWKATKRLQVKDVKESACLFAQSTKITS